MKRYAATLLALCFATQSYADNTWKCTMETQHPRTPGAVQNVIGFLPDIGKGQVYIVDAMILHLGKEYVAAKITSNTKERLKFEWSLNNLPTTEITTGEGMPLNWSFKAIFIRKNNNLVVRSVSGGETYVARRGKCEKR